MRVYSHQEQHEQYDLVCTTLVVRMHIQTYEIDHSNLVAGYPSFHKQYSHDQQ